jgi:hypothetical protein
MKRVVLVVVLFLCLLGTKVASGLGIVVHDPLSYANALMMLAQIINNYEKLKEQYDLEVWESTLIPVDMMAYSVPGVPWYEMSLPSDRFNRLSGWLQAVNAAGSAWDAYARATLGMKDVGGGLSQLTPEEQEKIGTRYGTEELTDGAAIHSIETIGNLRATAELADTALQTLEADSLSLAPEMNTEKAILNKINAASVASLRLTRDANRLSMSALEQQVLDSKRRRDAEVAELNAQAMRLYLGAEAQAEHTATVGESIRAFRWR